LAKNAERTVFTNATAAWLWTGRTAIITGRAAAALHGAKWVEASTPIDVIAKHTRRRSGVVVHEERITDDEITLIGELPVTTPARTALDIARHLPRNLAVVHLDALARATGVTSADALALLDRYRGARGIRAAQVALSLMDGGAESPRETWLRLVLIDDGLPPPRTQIRVSDGVRHTFIDMGYEEPMVGLDYEGRHHSDDRNQYVHDIGRAELIEQQNWIDIRVVAEHSQRFILHRLRAALSRRSWAPPKSA
ncbi:type IV toxin-antitoxin system AbiEi family antitoxin, partial [Mycolicibacterium gadium]